MTTLDDCWLKAGRAEKHLHEITEEFNLWRQRKPYEVVFDVNPKDEDDAGVGIRIHEYPPAYAGTILGDFLNNCRSVLDYITTRLDLEAGGRGDNIYFPIFTDRGAFKDHATKKLAHLNPGHVALIESLQPFNGMRRPFTRHPGAVLHALHRLDKHHAVTPTLAAPVSFRLHWVIDDRVRTQTVKAELKGEVHDGTEIARVRWPPWSAVRPRPRKMEMNATISFQIVFGDWDLPDATWAVLSWVRDDVLDRFVPILKKLG